MALKAIDPNQTKEITFPGDTDPKTVFSIGAIPAFVRNHYETSLQNAFLDDAEFITAVMESAEDGKEFTEKDIPPAILARIAVKAQKAMNNTDLVRHGLKGIKNPKGTKGGFKFETEELQIAGRTTTVAALSTLDQLEKEVFAYIAEEVNKFNSLSVAERGNS